MSAAQVTVIMVSYNTRALTLKALETLFANAGAVAMRVIVWDNASQDGSADAIAQAFGQVELIRSPKNLGFAAANNKVAAMAETPWLLLLNPDTETHSHAIENLVKFGESDARIGIAGGRTLFPDGTLNIASCWNRMTVWSLFCSAFGLSRAFVNSALFNPEAIGNWQRDSVRAVDIVVGCFFLIRTDLWRRLGGFDERYFMYGEEADLCLRARKLGYRPMITPDAQIMHLVGASTKRREDKLVPLLRAKATLVRDHWSPAIAPLGIALIWLAIANRRLASIFSRDARGELWRAVWHRRREFLRGY